MFSTCLPKNYRDLGKKVVVSCVNFILAVDLGTKLLVKILSLLFFYEKVKRPYKVQSLCKLLQQILLLLQCVI